MRGGRASLSFSVLALALALLTPGCVRPTSIECQVDLTDAERSALDVTCLVNAPAAESCVIKEMVQDDLLRPSVFRVSGPAGHDLPWIARPDAGIGSATRGFTERVVTLRGLRKFTYAYRVQPGAWVGSLVQGSHGTRFGYLDARGALLSGRNLFLLPSWYDSISDVRLTFRLPPGWKTYGTLTEGEQAIRRTGVGRGAAEMVEGIFGLGAFSEKTARISGDTLRLFARSDLPEGLQSEVFEAARKAFVYLSSTMGSLGHDYSIVVQPTPADGSMIQVSPSSGGQGSEMSATGPIEIVDLVSTMARAWTSFRSSPLRAKAAGAWLDEALPSFVGVAAAEAAGGRPAVAEWLRRARGARQDFVSLRRDSPIDDPVATRKRTAKGAFILAIADSMLAGSADGNGGAASILARSVLRDTTDLEPLATLARMGGGGWDLLERIAYSKSSIPAEWIARATRISPITLTLAPDPSSVGTASGHLALLVTGETRGMLEVCGCVARQTGGIARRETVRRRLVSRGDPVVLIDLGNSFVADSSEPRLDDVSLGETRLGLELMSRENYAAAAIGDAEMLRGPKAFIEIVGGLPIPYVNSNLEFMGRPVGAPSRLSRVGRLRIAWISVLDPSDYAESLQRYYEEHLAGLQVRDPLDALAQAARRVRARSNLVVAMGALSPTLIRSIVERIPEVDAVLSTEAAKAATDGVFAFETGDEFHLYGFYRGRLVYFSTAEGKWLEDLRLGIDKNNRIVEMGLEQHMLAEDVPDYRPFRERLASFYDSMKTNQSLAGRMIPVAQVLPALLKSDYVGGSWCARCHADEAQAWPESPHGAAFSVLLARHRNYAPRCVGCHVTGFGYPSGYHVGDPGEALRHVQCEMCHGPGSLHVLNPTAQNIVRQPPPQACFECHTPEHSDMNEANYPEYYARASHHPQPSAVAHSVR